MSFVEISMDFVDPNVEPVNQGKNSISSGVCQETKTFHDTKMLQVDPENVVKSEIFKILSFSMQAIFVQFLRHFSC